MTKAKMRASDRRYFEQCAAELQALAQAEGRIKAMAAPVDTWTPDRVGKVLVEALRWAHHAAGRVGASGMVGARLPEAILSLEDHAAAGWGLPEPADDPRDLPPMRVQLSPAQVSRHEAALEWPARYLCPDHVGSARIVGLGAV